MENTANNVGKSATRSNSEVTKELIQSEDGKENHIHSWAEANICTCQELVRKNIHKPRRGREKYRLPNYA